MMSDAIVSSAIQHYDTSTSAYAVNDTDVEVNVRDDNRILSHKSPNVRLEEEAQTSGAQATTTASIKFTDLVAPSVAAGYERNNAGIMEQTTSGMRNVLLHDAPAWRDSGEDQDSQGICNLDSKPGTSNVERKKRTGELKSCLSRHVLAGGAQIRDGNADRHVRFPEDGEMVTGAMPPNDPWRTAHVCSPEELVNSYRLACEAQSIRANPFIEEQLKAIAVREVTERHSGLCLKNIKLDTRHCEALEQVLRRVRFVTLDLENTQLDDDAACMLFDMVEFYESAIRLSLAHNVRLTLRGWLACARMLKMTHSLEYLDVRHCVFNEHTITVLARALKLVAHLTVLHLEHAAVSGRVLATLVAALRLNESVREVYLSDSRLLPSDGVHISALLKYNRTLQLLDLRNNTLQDVGLMHICEGLEEQNGETGLRTLILWNNQITHYSMAAFARAIALSKCLESVNIGSNNVTNEGVHQLKEGLLKNKSLMHFGLKASKIGCEGAVALAECIAESSQLQRIDLRGNDIRTGGLMALSLALRVNRNLQQLDLDREPKREPGVNDYAQTQKRLHETITEYTERNIQIVKLKEEVKQLLERQAESVKQMAERAAADDNGEASCNSDNLSIVSDANEPIAEEAIGSPVDIGVGEESTTRADDPVCNPTAQLDESVDDRGKKDSQFGAADEEEDEAGPDEDMVVLAEEVTGNEMTQATLERRRLSSSPFEDEHGLKASVMVARQLSPRNSLAPAPVVDSTVAPIPVPVPVQTTPPESVPIPLASIDVVASSSSPLQSPSPSLSPLPSSAATSSPRLSASFTLPASPAASPTTTFVRNRFSVSLVSPEELGVSRERLREIAAAKRAQRMTSVSVSDDRDLESGSDASRVAEGSSRLRSLSASMDT